MFRPISSVTVALRCVWRSCGSRWVGSRVTVHGSVFVDRGPSRILFGAQKYFTIFIFFAGGIPAHPIFSIFTCYLALSISCPRLRRGSVMSVLVKKIPDNLAVDKRRKKQCTRGKMHCMIMHFSLTLSSVSDKMNST